MDLELISSLAGERKNLCLILDNDQSIYGFRGSKIEEVMNMRNRFKDMKIHLLNTNYRSTQTIVEASKSLIKNNAELIKKNLKSNNEVGNPIIFYNEKDTVSEASRVVKLIKLCAEKGNFKYSDIAVLYRMNYQSRAVEEALLKYKIPYKIVGGTNFYSRKEVKDVMSYFRFVLNPNDIISFTRCINTPKRGIGDKTIEKIQKYSIENEVDLIEALTNVCSKGKIKEKTDKFVEIINSIKEQVDTEKPDELIEELVREVNYIEFLRESEKKAVADDRIENIQELLNVATTFETIEDLSNNIVLDSSVNAEETEEENCVQLLTMHSSKGLEWNVVICIGAIEGIMPSYRAVTTSDVEEERRLAYVAFTRAKKLLFITKPKYTIKQGAYIRSSESRFINEMDKKYLYRYKTMEV